jgi:glycosyltransferase involved in cell wall biosynthesis
VVPPRRQRAFRHLEQWAEVIVVQGHGMSMFRALRRSAKLIVADVYDPMHVEQLEQARERPPADYARIVADRVELLNEQLLRADFVMAASDRQRLFYLGQLAALGRLNPLTYNDGADLERLLAVVPFGLPTEPPVHEKQVLKGVVPGIGADDKVIIWGGGLYSWFDPLTLIRAIAELAPRRPNVRLFFQGTQHPGVAAMGIVEESRALAQHLGVLGVSVFFNDTWVPYEDRQNFLLEADLGVSTHGIHLETALAFRTRILDYLWAGLPMVVTAGDSFAELVEQERLGEVVPADDVEALAGALDRMLFDADAARAAGERIRSVRERFFWPRALAPLIDYVNAPWPAPDRALVRRTRSVRLRLVVPYGVRYDVRRVLAYYREGGWTAVRAKLRERRAAAVRVETRSGS